jgi:signal transduction histidine kinase
MAAEPVRLRRRPLSSVRVRVTLIALLVVSITFALGGVALEWQVQRSLTKDITSLVHTEAGDVAALVSSGQIPPRLVANRPGIGVQIVDDHHRVLTSTAELEGRGPVASVLPPAGRSVTLTGRHALPGDDDADVAVALSVATPHGTRTIYVLSTTQQAEDTAHDLVLPLLILIPLLIVVVGLLVWWLVGWALRPVEDIRTQVAEISGGDLHRRVTEPPVDDEVGRLARTMNAMLSRIESSAERQARFVSDASHELRSPLAALLAQLEVARSQPARADWQRVADTAIDDGRRLERIVNDLVLLARSDEGHLQPKRQGVDLDELVLAEAERLRAHGRVRVDLHDVGAGRVVGDPDLLQRVVRNLAENAERHAAGVVAFGVRTGRRWVELVVSDDGPGIPADQRTRVFERFTRLDEGRSRPSGGTGLGLAIVGEVVAAHGGDVRVGDGEAGTRMVVRLPVAETEIDALMEQSAERGAFLGSAPVRHVT